MAVDLDLKHPALHILTISTPVHLIRLPSSIALPPSFRIDDAPLLPPSFLSVTRTPEETSVITSLPWKDEELPTGQHTVEGPFKLLRIRGPLELNMLNVMAKLSAVLGAKGVSIMALSTYDTDYVAVREGKLEDAKSALVEAGWTVV